MKNVQKTLDRRVFFAKLQVYQVTRFSFQGRFGKSYRGQNKCSFTGSIVKTFLGQTQAGHVFTLRLKQKSQKTITRAFCVPVISITIATKVKYIFDMRTDRKKVRIPPNGVIKETSTEKERMQRENVR